MMRFLGGYLLASGIFSGVSVLAMNDQGKRVLIIELILLKHVVIFNIININLI